MIPRVLWLFTGAEEEPAASISKRNYNILGCETSTDVSADPAAFIFST
jgi:hypothetical protein